MSPRSLGLDASDAAHNPFLCMLTLLVGDLSSGCGVLRARPILHAPDEAFAHSLLVRHLASTRTPSPLPPISPLRSRPSLGPRPRARPHVNGKPPPQRQALPPHLRSACSPP